MSNQNRQIVRLIYTTREAFQSAAVGQERLSAFILSDPAEIGIQSEGSFRYITDQTAAVENLQAQITSQTNQIVTLAGQVGAATGVVHFGTTYAPHMSPLTFPHNSDSSGVPHDLLYADHAIPDNANFYGVARIMIATSRMVPATDENGLWIRAVNVGGVAQYRLYSSEASAIVGAGGVVTCDCPHGGGVFPFLDSSDNVWGYMYVPDYPSEIPNVGSASYHRLEASSGSYELTVDMLFLPGSRLRIPFRFKLGSGGTSASTILFDVLCNGGYLVEGMEFSLNTYGSETANFAGEVVVEYLDSEFISPPAIRRFRSWIELRGPDPVTSPIYPLHLPDPQVVGGDIPTGQGFISLCFRCNDGGGTDLETFELHSARAIYEGPATDLFAEF